MICFDIANLGYMDVIDKAVSSIIAWFAGK